MGAFPCCKKMENEKEINSPHPTKLQTRTNNSTPSPSPHSMPSKESFINSKKDDSKTNEPGEPITSPLKYITQEGIKPSKADIQISKPATFDSSTVSLQLTIIRGESDNKTVLLPPCGLAAQKDGNTVIGKEQCDYDIPMGNLDSKHFVIKFNNGKYFVKDLDSVYGTFVKAVTPIKLNHGTVVSYFDSHMIVLIDDKEIKVKFIEGPMKPKEYAFNINSLPILIGSDSKSHIVLNESLPKEQCRIIGYESMYYILDGDGNTNSMHGTWVYAFNYIEVNENSVFKANGMLFQTSIVNN